MSCASRVCFVVGAYLASGLLAAAPALAQQGSKDTQWRYYAGDSGSTKYSTLDQVNKDNVSKLKVAWSWDSADKTLSNANAMGAAFENTPLAVGNTLYTTTTLGQVAALDGRTGEAKWVFNPEAYKTGRATNLAVHRGLSYWTDGRQERLYLAAPNAYLWAIDARTGKPISEFGDAGSVNLAKSIPLAVNSRNYAESSPPVICKNVVIVGSSISDGPQNKEAPRGDIQAFDLKTGQPAWVFHTVPQEGEFGTETWENEAWRYSGNTNAWSCLSVDDELGLVYVPLGTPTNDWYGGHRLGDTLFAESIVCLDAATGKRVWHFQTVHHGVWDYDLPAAPILCDIKVNGRDIKAVAQITKTGFCWVFDRTNGTPVWPIEERPVPQSNVPGERLSPTQPFPTKPAPFERQGSTEDNVVDFTPEIRAEALAILNELDHGPIFTPPSERGTFQLPGWTGGANWWGASFDPDTGMLYIPSVTSPIVVKLTKPDPARSNFNFVRGGGARGTDGPRGLPLFKPPYGRITAINLNTGDHAWQIPHGEGQRKKFSEIVGHDVGPMGSGGVGPLCTKTLLFVAQGAGGRGPRAGGIDVIRAYDKATGAVIAEVPLPGTPSGTPMTYLADGKQYIVMAMLDGKLLAMNLP